jgi:hypothetical protein
MPQGAKEEKQEALIRPFALCAAELTLRFFFLQKSFKGLHFHKVFYKLV